MLKNVNTYDVLSAMEMGCITMSNVFNPNDNNVPYFASEVLPNPRLGFSEKHSESHVPGRHLNALLNTEDVIDLKIKNDTILNHKNAAFYSYSGVLPFPLNRAKTGGELVNFNEHNFREGFHALYPLIKYRKSTEAMEIAKKSISAIFDLWDLDNGWDYETLSSVYDLTFVPGEHTFITGLGRAIGPLVKLYNFTNYEPAIELAEMLVEKATKEFFLRDGSYDPETFGTHTHSTTCVMSSLAQFADLKNDSSLLKTVKNFYDNGLWNIRDQIGWVIENSGPSSEPDRGECNNTGDIVETALILGKNGYTEYFEDAERILRCHLLPAQLRDNSFIPETPKNHEIDGLNNVAERHLGAFGFPAPYGHWLVDQILDSDRPTHPWFSRDRISFNMDIVGGTVGSLCEVVRNIVLEYDSHYQVNLFFNSSKKMVGPDLFINDMGNNVKLKVVKPKDIWVRIPSWATNLPIEVTGTVGHVIDDEFIKISETKPDQEVDIKFQLQRREIILNHRKRKINVTLMGDNVETMDNFGANCTFFPSGS